MSRLSLSPLALLPLWLLACDGSGIELGEKPVDSIDDTGPDDSGPDDTDTVDDTDTDDTDDTDVPDDTGPDDTGTKPSFPDYDWLVDCNGGGDFTTIQAAIDAATSGDRIGLAPCEYHERINYISKYLDIFGIEGSAHTVIDGDYGGTVVDVEDAESDGTRLAGVSIEDGYDPAGGSALEVYYASLELEDVVFAGNGESLAVAHLIVGWVDMVDVVFEDNEIIAGGEAILTDGGSFSATRLRADCGAGDYAIWQHNATLLLDNELTCAAGYGLYSYHGELQVKRSRIEGGIAGIYAYDEEDTPSERAYIYNSAIGGGVEGARFEYMSVYIGNSVFWGAEAGLALLANSTGSWMVSNVFLNGACGITSDLAHTASHNAFWGNTANTCGLTSASAVTADPGFASFPEDLSIDASSPLVNAGYPDASWNDLDGSRNDIGLGGGRWAE
ncbi:MAG: hypothetical protein Q8P18_04980 [Pseudomonadota bacterium]|nr:hypothetical protein [Pseudomonadota bacterium]